MEQASPSGRDASFIVRFGEFELDLRSAELHKRNHKIRLQEQPFQILFELLERPGEVVLREEIRKKLWPNNTIVEFDHSINAAVKRLRDSLQDSAESPRYIETVARRGYRFIAAVSRELRRTPQAEVALLASAAARFTGGVSSDQQQQHASVAVLPFVNMSGETENEYFSDGLAEELIKRAVARARTEGNRADFRVRLQG